MKFNTPDLSKFDLPEMRNQVKELMIKLGYNVVEGDMPTIRFDGLIKTDAAYDYLTNEILIKRFFQYGDFTLKTAIAHELCHSLQGVTYNDTIGSYASLRVENEAYTLQNLYLVTHQIPVLSKQGWYLRLVNKISSKRLCKLEANVKERLVKTFKDMKDPNREKDLFDGFLKDLPF